MEGGTEGLPRDSRRVLALTGGTGFIGGAMARRFVHAGWHIRALVRSGSKARALVDLGAEPIPGDVTVPETLPALVQGASAVVHCAGAVRGLAADDFNRVNVTGVANLARAASALREPPRFIALSSLAAREPRLSAYAESKLEGEAALARNAGPMSWVALRPPAVYGPGDRELRPLLRAMACGMAPVLGAADACFSMLYVDDLATAAEACLGAAEFPTGVFELHDGRSGGYRWHDIVRIAAGLRGRPVRSLHVSTRVLGGLAGLSVAWARLSGQAPMLTPGKIRELTHPDWVCDNAALTQACGWSPAIAFAEGLKRTLA